ncbi:MAG: hypothetical protein LVQ95_03770 [Candidatus Micrarchaeales archaeon]|nr:hypothetical protein [Candidatus Micrarchaeales archaeon]
MASRATSVRGPFWKAAMLVLVFSIAIILAAALVSAAYPNSSTTIFLIATILYIIAFVIIIVFRLRWMAMYLERKGSLVKIRSNKKQ